MSYELDSERSQRLEGLRWNDVFWAFQFIIHCLENTAIGSLADVNRTSFVGVVSLKSHFSDTLD